MHAPAPRPSRPPRRTRPRPRLTTAAPPDCASPAACPPSCLKPDENRVKQATFMHVTVKSDCAALAASPPSCLKPVVMG